MIYFNSAAIVVLMTKLAYRQCLVLHTDQYYECLCHINSSMLA
jgi:hypothetical protein